MLPSEIKTGLVTGQFIITVIDNDDPDFKPQIVPAQGKVTFKPSVDYIPYPGLTPNAVTVMQGPIVGILDSEGYLCTPHPVTGEPLYQGVHLNAADDPEAAVKGWSWSASPSLTNSKLAVKSINFVLNTGDVVDLGKLISVPSTPGYGLPQAESSALRAEAAAQVALDVKAMADAGDFDGEQGLPGNATMRVDTTVGTRIFISDGVTEQLVKSDTSHRDISGSLASGLTKSISPNATAPTIRRVNDQVFLSLYLDVANSGTEVYVPPYGFRPKPTISTPGQLFIDSTKVGSGLPSEVKGWYLSKASGVRSSGALGFNTTIMLTATWETPDPWPTTLPGTPA